MEFKLKKDKYKSARGGHSHLLDIYCRKCENKVLVYQKDGPGALRRMYLDRIFAPEGLKNLHIKKLEEIDNLKCEKCWAVLGIPYIYEKEKRKAFRVFGNIIIKKTTWK